MLTIRIVNINKKLCFQKHKGKGMIKDIDALLVKKLDTKKTWKCGLILVGEKE